MTGEPGRDSFAAYRELMAAHGFRPSRRLGQNFLLDPSLHRVLVEAVAPQPDDVVLEVGAGLGFLTRELAGRCPVVAVEIDRRLCAILRQEVPGFAAGGAAIRLVEQDVLARGRLHPEVLAALDELRPGSGRFLVVSNLPYAIAGPFLAELLLQPEAPAQMALLVQFELAQRLAAEADTRAYGALSVQLQLGYAVRLVRKVGAQVFRPRPQVDSAIVTLTARPDGCLSRSAAERRALQGFLRQLFSSRRKKVRNARVLATVDRDRLPAGLLERRPDAVPPAELLALWDRIRSGQSTEEFP